MYLVLDTNIFHKHSLRGTHFSALARISSGGYIDLCIPYIVEKELITHTIDSIEKSFSEIGTNLAKLRRNKGLSAPDCNELKKIDDDLEIIKKDLITEKVIGNWEAWKSLAKAEVLPLLHRESTAGMDAYFNGDLPFEKAKARKDIPDAFIFQQLQTLADKGDVLFVCQDGRLKRAAHSIGNITTLEDLPEFFESDPAKQYFTKISEDQLASNIDIIKSFLRTELNNIKSTVETLAGDSIADITIESYDSYSNDNQYDVSSYGDVNDVSLDLSELNYFGDGEFELPVEFEVEAGIEYYIDKSEYYSLTAAESPYVTDWNDHVYLAESEEVLHAKGRLKITTSTESLHDIIFRNGRGDISNFEITIDLIDSLEITN